MEKRTVLAVDLGTTNCKTVLLDAQCRIVQKHTVEYPVSVPRPGWAEQQPEEWWQAVKASIRRVVAQADAGAVGAIGLSGQMHGLVALDARGQVVRPAILWNDQRSAPQCEEIYARVGGRDGLRTHTNNPMLPGYTGGKILWLRANEPEHYAAVATVLLPKDYIRYRMTGAYGTDVSDASGTGLFDVRRRCWAAALLDTLELPERWFPHVHESADVVGELDAGLAAELGLPARVPVLAGGGDAVMQTLGSGAVASDVALVVIGTGGNVTVSLPEPMENPGSTLQVFCHVAPRRWVAMGVTLSAGSSLKWYRDTLGGLERQLAADLRRDAYDLLGQEAALSPPGANGLIFLPYLQGERCPHVDVHARGVLFGLGLRTGKADVVRSIMEGVTFSLRDVLELIQQAGFRPAQIRASGGGSSSALWRQIQADVFNREVTTFASSEDAGAIGAAIVAGIQAGFWPSADAAVALLRTATQDRPIQENAETYERLFALYRTLYPALKPAFETLSCAAA
jgi:xylulokinase